MSLKNRFLSFILGDDSMDEKAQLERWQLDAKANIEGLNALSKPEDELQILSDYQDVNQDEAWRAIEQRMKPKRMVVMRNIAKVAAVAILILGALWSFSRWNDSAFTQEPALMTYHAAENLKLQYKDGSNIDLDIHSDLIEVAYRQFDLSGRAFFAVAKDPEHAFKIHTLHGDIEVLGTAFNVVAGQEETDVFVREGRVQITYEGKKYILNAEDNIVLRTGEAIVSSQPQVYPDVWRTQEIRFENQSFHYVMETLAMYYNLKISWNPSLSAEDACKINTTIQNQKLDAVLQEMEILAGLKYEIKTGRIIIHEFKC